MIYSAYLSVFPRSELGGGRSPPSGFSGFSHTAYAQLLKHYYHVNTATSPKGRIVAAPPEMLVLVFYLLLLLLVLLCVGFCGSGGTTLHFEK